jgi:predicted  nucleic acid-binding Zn-ribbon protein
MKKSKTFSDLTRQELIKRGLAMCDQVSALEDERAALRAEARNLKRQLRALNDVHDLAVRQTEEQYAQIIEQNVEIERQRALLIEKGVVELPEHALRAMDTKDGQPGVRADRFTRPAL